MHPIEQDSGYHIFAIPGLGSGIFGPISMIFGQILVKLFAPFSAGDALLKAGTHFMKKKVSLGTLNQVENLRPIIFHRFEVESAGYDRREPRACRSKPAQKNHKKESVLIL